MDETPATQLTMFGATASPPRDTRLVQGRELDILDAVFDLAAKGVSVSSVALAERLSGRVSRSQLRRALAQLRAHGYLASVGRPGGGRVWQLTATGRAAHTRLRLDLGLRERSLVWELYRGGAADAVWLAKSLRAQGHDADSRRVAAWLRPLVVSGLVEAQQHDNRRRYALSARGTALVDAELLAA